MYSEIFILFLCGIDHRFPYFDCRYSFPVNLNNSHWVCAQIYLNKKQIRIFDSYDLLYETKEFNNMVAPLQHILPKWLEFIEFYNDRPFLFDGKPWKLMKMKGMPQQEGGVVEIVACSCLCILIIICCLRCLTSIGGTPPF